VIPPEIYTPVSNPSDERNEGMMQFEMIFNTLAQEKGLENMVFPKRIMWLSGAPGSGKSEMTDFIMQTQGIETKPINVGSLLQSESQQKLKSSGILVQDREVISALLRKLLEPEYSGRYVLVDGFPRTPNEAQSISLLYDNMLILRRKFEKTKHFSKFPRPVFHVTVLYVDEKVSIERQMQRGTKGIERNKTLKLTGLGSPADVRETDLDEAKARFRYLQFHSQMYHSLQLIQKKFPFHFINAEGSREAVKKSIEIELAYQSNAELADSTFDNVRRIPLAGEIKKDARLELVQRLDGYERLHKKLFDEVIALIIRDFVPVIKQQALTGQAILRSENPIFFGDRGLALRMVLDLLSERGYRVVLDYVKDSYPEKIDLNTGQVTCGVRKILAFHISFPQPKIRHATAESVDGWDTHIV